MSQRVLLIDDSAESQTAIAELLGRCFCTVTFATRADAIAIAAECNPQTIILDLDSLGAYGYELAHQFRSVPGRHDAVLVGASSSSADLPAMSDAGIRHFLAKPVELRRLQRILYGGKTSPAAVSSPIA